MVGVVGVDVRDHFPPSAFRLRGHALFKFALVGVREELAKLLNHRVEFCEVGLPVRFGELAGAERLVVVGDVVFERDAFEPLYVCLDVICDVRDEFPNAIVIVTVRLPSRLLDGDAVQGIPDRHEPTVTVVTQVELLQ